MLTTFWPGKTIGRPLTSSCSFANATTEPANEIDPISAERTIETVSSRTGSSGVVPLGERDERGRAAPDPVEDRDHLRHRGHPHVARPDDADHAADDEPDDHQQPVPDAVQEERRPDREEHPRPADPVPLARVARRREELQRDDEADDRDEVEEADDVGIGDHSPLSCASAPGAA